MSEDKSADIGIATWFLATTFLIMYLSRQLVKFIILRKFQLDDYFISAATLFSLGMSLAYSYASQHGLGEGQVTPEESRMAQQAYYAAEILFILAIYCVKLSLTVFYDNLAVDMIQKRIILGLAVFSTATAVSMLLSAGFQCGVSGSWEIMSAHCFNQMLFWNFFGALDILTDVCLVLVSVMLVWNLRIPISKKAIVVGCFAPRIMVVAAAACRLAYLPSIAPQDHPIFSTWVLVICTEMQTCISISTACIPCIKPFFEAVEGGVWQADQLRRRGFTINDLFRKGYAKPSPDWTISQRATSVLDLQANPSSPFEGPRRTHVGYGSDMLYSTGE